MCLYCWPLLVKGWNIIPTPIPPYLMSYFDTPSKFAVYFECHFIQVWPYMQGHAKMVSNNTACRKSEWITDNEKGTKIKLIKVCSSMQIPICNNLNYPHFSSQLSSLILETALFAPLTWNVLRIIKTLCTPSLMALLILIHMNESQSKSFNSVWSLQCICRYKRETVYVLVRGGGLGFRVWGLLPDPPLHG